jgi:23S rRNA-/tRNA-specific pseudouridylate synthase
MVSCSIFEGSIQIDAPIAVADIMRGVRTVNQNGKDAKSVFKLLAYDSTSDTSLIYASPITG